MSVIQSFIDRLNNVPDAILQPCDWEGLRLAILQRYGGNGVSWSQVLERFGLHARDDFLLNLISRRYAVDFGSQLVLSLVRDICREVGIPCDNNRRSFPLFSFYQAKISWLALHGVPSRSIAFVMRYDFAVFGYLGSEYPRPQVMLEQHVQIIHHYIRNAFHRTLRTWAWASLGSDYPEYADNWFENIRKLAEIPLDSTYQLLQVAMAHALLDEGKEICSPRAIHHAKRYGATDERNQEQEEILLLWRIIAGRRPRLARGSSMPRKIKKLMIERFEEEKLDRQIEAQLYFEKGEDLEEFEMM
jgi:hypothetical protein